jgi:hypothetical protein
MKTLARSLPRCALLASLGALLFSGCLQVRETEHRIRLNKDGSGDHRLRLIDIRSDGATDSAVVHDFNVMMSSYDEGGGEEFESKGRTLLDKKMYTHGDTLIAEITYGFNELAAVEGLRVTEDELFVVVSPGREVLRTNGKIKTDENGAKRIVWDRDALRLYYVIREREMPEGVSLARLFRGEKMDLRGKN